MKIKKIIIIKFSRIGKKSFGLQYLVEWCVVGVVVLDDRVIVSLVVGHQEAPSAHVRVVLLTGVKQVTVEEQTVP